MRFTERTHLNDPSEVSHGIEVAGAILGKRGGGQDAKRLRDCTEIVFRDFRFFSASSSQEHDKLSQWQKYADDGGGVELSFKASAFGNPKAHIERFIDGATAVVCPMPYESWRLEGVIGSIIDLWSGTNISEPCDYLFMISSMFKNDFWKSEKECRFFVPQKREKILKCVYYKSHERSGQIAAYLDLPIQNRESEDDVMPAQVGLGQGDLRPHRSP